MGGGGGGGGGRGEEGSMHITSLGETQKYKYEPVILRS